MGRADERPWAKTAPVVSKWLGPRVHVVASRSRKAITCRGSFTAHPGRLRGCPPRRRPLFVQFYAPCCPDSPPNRGEAEVGASEAIQHEQADPSQQSSKTSPQSSPTSKPISTHPRFRRSVCALDNSDPPFTHLHDTQSGDSFSNSSKYTAGRWRMPTPSSQKMYVGRKHKVAGAWSDGVTGHPNALSVCF